MKLDDNLRKSIHEQLVARPATQPKANANEYKFKPYASDALGVHETQIPQAREEMRKHGIAAEFTPDGKMIIESERQFREAARAAYLYDGRDGYGVKDSDGRLVPTGRELQKRRAEFRQKVLSGEIEL